MTPPNALDAPTLAKMFHEAYERLAPQFGYETREQSRKPWDEVPENNRKLMTAVCAEIMEHALASEAALQRIGADGEEFDNLPSDQHARRLMAAIARNALASPSWQPVPTNHEAIARRTLDNVYKKLAMSPDALAALKAEVRHGMNQKIGEYLGEDANSTSTLQMLDNALIKRELSVRREVIEECAKAACEWCRRGLSIVDDKVCNANGWYFHKVDGIQYNCVSWAIWNLAAPPAVTRDKP